MPSFSILSEINSSFNNIATHSKYMIRERIYHGKGAFKGYAVSDIHSKFNDISKLIEENISEKKFKQSKLPELCDKLNDTINLIIELNQYTPKTEEIVKLIQLAELLTRELETEYNKTTKREEISDETIIKNQINDYKNKIIDNLTQIQINLNREFEINNDTKIDINKKIDDIKSYTEKINEIKKLRSLSIIILKIRNNLTNNKDQLKLNINAVVSMAVFYSSNISEIEVENVDDIYSHITINDIITDIENKINVNRITWLLSLYQNIVYDPYSINDINKFFKKLFILSRDPREDYLWTMSNIARLTQSDELDKLSVHYATLASILLNLINTLNELGLTHISKRITNIREIDFKDAIQDISDLYNPKNIDVENLIRAVRYKLKEIKELCNSVIEFNDLAYEFFNIVQFTDMDANLTSIDDLKEYINKY